MSLVFDARNSSEALTVPQAPATGAAVLTSRIGFHGGAPLEVMYRPYVVVFTAPVDASGTATVQLVNSDSGELVSGVDRRIDLTDLQTVYRAAPSTVPTQEDFDAGRTLGFLMLDTRHLAGGLATDAAAAEVNTAHKYPRTASSQRLFEAVALIRELLALDGVLGQLPPALRRQLERLLGGSL